MKLPPLQKRAARHARNKFSVDLNLVSLIDIFTILIFFLLPTHRRSRCCRAPRREVAGVHGRKDPKETLVVLVSNQDIVVQGRKVSSVSER